MFQNYYDLIEEVISNMWLQKSGANFIDYIKSALGGIWIIISHALLVIGIAGIFFAPHLYISWVSKIVYNKNKTLNDELYETVIKYEELCNVADYYLFAREKSEMIKKIDNLIKQKDLSTLKKTILLSVPVFIIYLSFSMPLLLIILDLFFKVSSVKWTIFVSISYLSIMTLHLSNLLYKLYCKETRC